MHRVWMQVSRLSVSLEICHITIKTLKDTDLISYTIIIAHSISQTFSSGIFFFEFDWSVLTKLDGMSVIECPSMTLLMITFWPILAVCSVLVDEGHSQIFSKRSKVVVSTDSKLCCVAWDSHWDLWRKTKTGPQSSSHVFTQKFTPF